MAKVKGAHDLIDVVQPRHSVAGISERNCRIRRTALPRVPVRNAPSAIAGRLASCIAEEGAQGFATPWRTGILAGVTDDPRERQS